MAMKAARKQHGEAYGLVLHVPQVFAQEIERLFAHRKKLEE